ncbi:MAG: glycoside hydrolase family 5 protein [Bacteroidales bacterium]|nr:glycoside hydrolase family 5 protein [Bacteroidales bacterium]
MKHFASTRRCSHHSIATPTAAPLPNRRRSAGTSELTSGNRFRRVSLPAIVGLLLVIGCSLQLHSAPRKSPVAVNGQLRVEGTQLVNEKGTPVMLRGTSFGWHNFWPRFYNEGAVSWMRKDWKINVVRAAMGVGPENSYLQNPEFGEKCVTDVADAAIRQGIYVIIDFHSHKIHTEVAADFFTRMANRYKDVPNVIYEIFNEPDYYEWPEVKNYSEELIRTIRAIDPDNIILVGSPHWDQDIHLVADDPIREVSNIMYTMHFYAGTHKQWLRDRTDDAIRKGIPIFVSECAGMEATGDGPIDHQEWKAFVGWMENRNISWVVWSVSDKNETCSMLTPDAAAGGNWKKQQIKEWGQISRSYIRARNN